MGLVFVFVFVFGFGFGLEVPILTTQVRRLLLPLLPPNLGMSKQCTHSPQSLLGPSRKLAQPSQPPQRLNAGVTLAGLRVLVRARARAGFSARVSARGSARK